MKTTLLACGLLLAAYAMAGQVGAEGEPVPAGARLNDIRMHVTEDRVELRLIGMGELTYETFWVTRPSGEYFIMDLPGVTLARVMSLDPATMSFDDPMYAADIAYGSEPVFESDAGDTLARNNRAWRGWPVYSVRTSQLLVEPPMARVTIRMASVPVATESGTGMRRPDIRIASGMSELVVTVSSSLRHLPAPASIAAQLAGDADSRSPTSRISLRFTNTDLTEILHAIAEQSSMNLVIDPNLKVTTTVRLDDVTVSDALNALLKGSGFGWLIDGNLIRVVPDKFIPTTRVVIPVGDANGEALVTLLKSYVAEPSLLLYDQQSHAILYTASQPGEAETIRAMAAEISRRESQRPLDGEGRPFLSNVPLRYADPKDVVTLLQAMLADDKITVIADPRSHSVLLRAPDRTTLARTLRLIQTLDKPTPQILLKARIIETSVNAGDIIGVDWSNSLTASVSGVSQISKLPLRPDEPFGNGPVLGDGIIPGTLNVTSISATFNFLQAHGNSILLSAPEIMVMDREDAVIIVGTKEPIRTTTTSNGVVSENVTFIDVGIVLKVTPVVLPGNRVMLNVHPENSSASPSEINGIPRINTSEATTRIMIEDGRTAVIGGLYSQNSTDATEQVPFLGNLPFIGKLFRSRNKASGRRNLMVFITPYIVGDSGMPTLETVIEGPDEAPTGRWIQEFRDEDARWMDRLRRFTGPEKNTDPSAQSDLDGNDGNSAARRRESAVPVGATP